MNLSDCEQGKRRVNKFGLKFEYRRAWCSSCKIFWAGAVLDILVTFECDVIELGISELQAAAFENFINHAAELMRLCDQELRHQLEEENARVTFPTEIFLTRDRFFDGTEICIMFDSPVEPELGLAIRFRNEKIDHFGIQDDVL